MRPIALSFTKTVLLPAASELACVSGIDGQVCAAHPSPRRCTGLPLQNTSELPPVDGRGGQQPWPVQLSPCRVTAGIVSSNQFEELGRTCCRQIEIACHHRS